jgi:hypothetical protein
MKTLFTVIAAIAVVGVGAVGGFDYASQGQIGILPSCVTGHCQKSDSSSGSYCPMSQEDSSTSPCPDCDDEGASGCPSCCKKTRTKSNVRQASKK